MSMGSSEGYAHTHWRIAALPPGVPYEKQQFHALMAESTPVLEVTTGQAQSLADRLRTALASLHGGAQGAAR